MYLIHISKEASVRAREAKRKEQYDETWREERRMWKEQYPCEENGEMDYHRVPVRLDVVLVMSLKNLVSNGIFFQAFTENLALEHWFPTFRTLNTG